MSYHYQKNQEGYQDESYDLNQTNYGGQYRDEPQGGNGYSQYPMTSSNAVAGSSPYALPQKKRRNKWLWIGLPILIVAIIIAAVVGGVVGSRKSGNSNSSSSSSSGSTGSNAGASGGNSNAGIGATATGANGNQDVYLAVNTDTYMLPEYPTATATSGYSAPTVIASPAANGAWPTDPDSPSTTSPRAHPRLIAPGYKWTALQNGLIAADPYLKYWNETIIANATTQMQDAPKAYILDGGVSGSGVLDIAREIKLKVKNWAYAYKMTNNTAFLNRVYLELQTAAGNNTNSGISPAWPTDGTQWNAQHFLDLAEFCNAFAIAYDWLYDAWSADQRSSIRASIVNLGLNIGLQAFNKQNNVPNWWTGTLVGSAPIGGNWNCVINGGLTMAALAIISEDTTNTASQILEFTIPNAKANCMTAVHDDGTWAETANYWYFGTTGLAEMSSALVTAYGSDQGLLQSNTAWNLTSLYHMHVQGMTSLFNYGDHGPNKFSTTANSLIYFANQFNEPRYALYQRDHYDASEPWSMFWYNPALSGAWWDGLPLDNYFGNADNEWAAMRNSWTNNDGNYIAMKSGNLQGHQTHGDLDIGDFVIDALGQRWAGELGSGQYLSTDYFASEAQTSDRWLYYRKRTEGQNTLVQGYQNQVVTANTTGTFGTTGEAQGPAPGWTTPSGSSAFFVTDMSEAYNGTSIKRGLRFINDRKQILLQDDVSGATEDIQWRMHTNATMAFGSGNKTVTLSLGGQTLQASIVQGPSNAVFEQLPATRYSSDPTVPSSTAQVVVPQITSSGEQQQTVSQDSLNADQSNGDTTVLAITIAGGGTFSLQVLFNPQYSGASSSSYISAKNVALGDWSTTSHNA